MPFSKQMYKMSSTVELYLYIHSNNYPGGVGDDSVRKLLAGASPLESESEINRIQS